MPKVEMGWRQDATQNHAIKNWQQGATVRINIFEGGRRIALLIGILWAVGCVAYAAFTEPYTSITYVVPHLNTPPILAKECLSDDAHEHLVLQSPNGKSVRVNLCFKASKADSGEMLVPYEDAGSGRVWMKKRHDSDVAKYTTAFAQTFQLSEQVMEAANAERRAALLEQWKWALMTLFGGVAVGWGFVASIGWIARGFMGIPRGKDARPAL